MAAHLIAIVHDGIVEIPNDLKNDPQFRNGASLRLVPVATAGSGAGVLTKGEWRRLEGMLADSNFDPNAALEAEKQRELLCDCKAL